MALSRALGGVPEVLTHGQFNSLRGRRLDGSEASSLPGVPCGFGPGCLQACPEDRCVCGRRACPPPTGILTFRPTPTQSAENGRLNTELQLYQLARLRPSMHFWLELFRSSEKYKVFHVTLKIPSILCARQGTPSAPWCSNPATSSLCTDF